MADTMILQNVDVDPQETKEWLDSLDDLMRRLGPKRVRYMLTALQEKAYREGVTLPFTANTPYINSIPLEHQPRFPGNRELERQIKSIIRWNAMAMVVRANKESAGIGGHISTYASAATLWEIGFNHFFRAKTDKFVGDQVYFQGHASPGVYARAYLEGRLTEKNLKNFRRELADGGGLSSYPHPWLMPHLWEYPTVSMGLGPIMAIYRARFNRYLHDRGLCDTTGAKIWCFVGDGETDEPETLGAINLAAREGLDNLIFVINCNLQRLDGPVRGNGKIIQDLEGVFRGAGWKCLKVIWGGDWDPLLAKDHDGQLVGRMGEVVDGEYQKYVVEDGAYIREHFFGKSPALLRMVEQLSDGDIHAMRRGGHDPEKVYAAYQAAMEHRGSPTVILAKTIKGYGLGEAGEGRNITHSQKKLNEEELREFRTRFNIPVSDEELAKTPFYRPPENSPEMQYLRERRKALGGYLPARNPKPPKFKAPALGEYAEFLKDSAGREVSTTMAFVRMFGRMLREPELGKMIVPIIPDEARTFGMEALFRQCGIYSRVGQLYEPVDKESMLYYREAKDGQILEEGITEAGAMSSFIAAGTAYSTHDVNTIPFYIYYSMFGFQRVGDLIWAAADSRCKGFLLGGTAGRTTLNGEGLQHQDGHSHLLASAVPSVKSYDPAFMFEIAVIVIDGLKRMYVDNEPGFYYITLGNENYVMPAMPKGAEEGIVKGMYKLQSKEAAGSKLRVQLFGSASILREAMRAGDILATQYGVSSDIWSVTSYKALREDALAAERWNRLHPTKKPRVSFVEQSLKGVKGPFIAASDYVRLVMEQIAPWVPEKLITLGTDGFGRSETREALRRHFEVDAESIVIAALHELAARGSYKPADVEKAIKELGVDAEKANPIEA
ncbi:MAG: pyruvate dehydrogenase (acetyl-transferring), homodimeric type [Planctomycetota bacterium]